MAIEMKTTKIPTAEDTLEQLHARAVDRVRMQCAICKRNKPDTPTKDCDIKVKLVVKDSDVAWKHKHLFLTLQGECKMFKIKDSKR